MSSSNLVKISVIEETVYGDTPAVGDFKAARFTSEKLSGTPETTESQQIRTDRQSSGQVVVGMTVGGNIDVELAKEPVLEDFIASAMLSSWITSALKTVDLTLDATAKTLVRIAGSFITDGVVVGDFVKLGGFTNTKNNKVVMITKVQALTLTYVGPDGMANEAGSGTTFKVCDKISIGTTKKSFTIEKHFSDLTEKAIIYRGMLASEMKLSINYGEIVKGSFSFSGNDQKTVDAVADFVTNTRTILPQATSNSMNGSVDMPFIATSAVADLEAADFCINSVEINLNNNLTAQNCIGEIAPKSYSPGTANISIDLKTYLADENWSILKNKLQQTPFSIGFAVQNNEGMYGFYLPAIQVSMDDPSAGGSNQDIMLETKGMARVGLNNESSLTIYRA